MNEFTLRLLSNFEHLRGELADRDCTGWTCPYCETSAYKVFGYECDECGFRCDDMLPEQSA